MNTVSAVVEKDFWVVWTLKHLYELQNAPPFIFKGGTSLSKAFGLIERFSEDIDLIIDRSYFGYTGADDIASASSKSAAARRMENLKGDIAHYIASNLLPALQARCEGVLTESFRLEVDTTNAQTIVLNYPTEPPQGYIRPMVLIETGGNADNWPTVTRTITPYVADCIPNVFHPSDVDVTTIEAVRTFWEKLTILHKTAHRFDLQPEWHLADRYSRHYYDVYRLARANVAGGDLTSAGLIDAVRVAAETFFADPKAKYEEFAPGSIRLIPSNQGIVTLRRDYEAMRDMIFGAYPSFDDIIAELRELDQIVNPKQ